MLESHAEWNLRICQLLEMGHYGHKKALGRKKAPPIEGALEIKQFQKNTTLAVAFVYSNIDRNGLTPNYDLVLECPINEYSCAITGSVLLFKASTHENK